MSLKIKPSNICNPHGRSELDNRNAAKNKPQYILVSNP